MEQTNISERITMIINHLEISTNDFATKLGYGRSQGLYDIISQKSKPSYAFFEKLVTSCYGEKFSLEWLISGRGQMIKEKYIINNDHYLNENMALRSLNDAQKTIIDLQKKEIDRLEKTLLTIQNLG